MANRQEDVIYARQYGTALTLDVFRPACSPNGIGLIFVISGGWTSSHAAITDYAPPFIEPLVKRGYTVFAVVVRSQPRFSIPEIIEDMHSAVRYVRHHANEYGIDRDRLGIYGCSAGGHLSLLLAYSGGPGDPNALEPADRESSEVQAVAEFYGPTDLLNYGEVGQSALGENILANHKPPFDFHEFDESSRLFVKVTDPVRYAEIGREISPITHVRSGAPPTLLIHGDADELVPIQQSLILVEKLKDAGVKHRLLTVPGAAHGWEDMSGEVQQIGDWFDQNLLQ